MTAPRHTVSLILVPSLAALYDPRYARSSPLPLVLGVLQGYLRARGYDVVSTDLNAHMSAYAALPLEKGWALLYDEERVLGYLRGGTDRDLDALLDRILTDTAAAEGDVVGISTGPDMALFEIHLALLLGRRVRTAFGRPVVFGGLNLGFLWHFRDAFAPLWDAIGSGQYLFVGPGERSLARLIAGGADLRDDRLYRSLPGAIHGSGRGLTRNPYDAPTFVTPDFTGLPLAHYTLCCDVTPPAADSERRTLTQYYKWPASRAVRVSESNRQHLPAARRAERLFIPYVFNYNCPHRCAFCVQSRADKPPSANADARTVVADLERLSRDYATPYFRFYNNAFNYSAAFVADFCRLVRERELSIRWSDCARFDNLDEDLVDRLFLAGCRKLIFGLDTASPKLLRLIHKGIDLDQARRVLGWCRQRGIWAEIEVIVGLPFETEPEFRATYDFVQGETEKGTLNDFHVNRYFVLPESLLGSEPQRYGIEIERAAAGYGRAVQREYERLDRVLAAREQRTAPDGPPLRRQTLWSYREVGGRSATQIEEETEQKFWRMMALKERLAG